MRINEFQRNLANLQYGDPNPKIVVQTPQGKYLQEIAEVFNAIDDDGLTIVIIITRHRQLRDETEWRGL